jgi:ATP-dependent Clp protease ATP-binding subunit ClpX
VVLDEFDKIARRETMNGRDVGGEGVQQALLKLVEGTKVTINIKDNKSSRGPPPSGFNPQGGPNINNPPAGSSASSHSPHPPPPPPPGKMEQYTIDTSNILFVFCGAFVGLDKHVIRRVAKPSIGFGSELRGRVSASGSKHILPPDMYSHLPHQAEPGSQAAESSQFTPLDLTTPEDLQAFGFIPELIGRVHNICALSPLSHNDLLRILTEPRNSLVAQYKELFLTYPSNLEYTNRALTAIADRAAKSETGARGLKMEMERVLAGPMFQAPNDYVLITEASVRGTDLPLYWGKDGRFEWEKRKVEEDEAGEGVSAGATLGELRKQYEVDDMQAEGSGA